MKKEIKTTIVASCAALLMIFLGVVNGKNDSEYVSLLTTEIELTREYIDLIISERLSEAASQDPELLLAKEEVINKVELKLGKTLQGIEQRNSSGAGFIMALGFLQLVIILIALSEDPPGRITARATQVLLALAVLTGALAILRLWM